MSKRKNDTLTNAKNDKYSEYMTLSNTIYRELGNYRNDFRGKVVYCNTDDQYSNFFKYFAGLFDVLGLKQLVATKYVEGGRGVMIVYNGEMIDGRVPDESKYMVSELEGDGDFRSPECKAIMNICDVVVTNPPLYLFREFIKLIMSKDKKFLVIGNMNAVACKEIFPLLKENRVHWGYEGHSVMTFQCPDNYKPDKPTGSYHVTEDGKKFRDIQGCVWYTNLDVDKHHYDLDFYREYKKDAALYPRYDNYDAIEVGHVVDIPMDYPGVMGVPITFLDKYNPEQFEILGMATKANCPKELHVDGHDYVRTIEGKELYHRIFIRFKEGKIDPLGYGIATPDRDWVANPQTYEERKERYRRPIEK